jgi:quercetin dioxygenase-like cupin family protein
MEIVSFGETCLRLRGREGIVATEHEEQTVRAGDVAYIPAGERHWHGAKPGLDMTHLAILGSGKTFIVADDRPAD